MVRTLLHTMRRKVQIICTFLRIIFNISSIICMLTALCNALLQGISAFSVQEYLHLQNHKTQYQNFIFCRSALTRPQCLYMINYNSEFWPFLSHYDRIFLSVVPTPKRNVQPRMGDMIVENRL